MNKFNRRVAAGTKLARQLASATSKVIPFHGFAQSQEVADWNAEVERKKQAKQEAKAAKKAQS